jgi:hypothetical protein
LTSFTVLAVEAAILPAAAPPLRDERETGCGGDGVGGGGCWLGARVLWNLLERDWGGIWAGPSWAEKRGRVKAHGRTFKIIIIINRLV